MDTRKNKEENPQQQGANVSTVDNVNNPFGNGQRIDDEVQEAKEELEKEQQFKEAQTERD